MIGQFCGFYKSKGVLHTYGLFNYLNQIISLTFNFTHKPKTVTRRVTTMLLGFRETLR